MKKMHRQSLKTMAALLLFAYTAKAQTIKQADSLAGRNYFYAARACIDSMLAGTAKPDFEKAVFVTENAYWNNAMRYSAFDSVIDYHAGRISAMVEAMKKHDTTVTKALYPTDSKEEKTEAHEKLQKNWGIFTYMTDTTYFLRKDTLIAYHTPYQYSNHDPYGTTNWANTEVTGLLMNHRGNCYAMACLYKIMADKLNTGAAIA